MRQWLCILLIGSCLLTGCPMGSGSSSLRNVGVEAVSSGTASAGAEGRSDTATAVAAAPGLVEAEHATKQRRERPVVVPREGGGSLEVHADKVEVTAGDGGSLGATIVQEGATVAHNVPLGDIGDVPLQPNSEYVVQIEDLTDPTRPEPVEEITVVTPARPPEVVSVEPLAGDRVLVEIDMRDNPPGTPLALGVASKGAGEPELLLDPRTGAALPAGADPFIDPNAALTADAPADEQAAEGATVGVELGATVGVTSVGEAADGGGSAGGGQVASSNGFAGGDVASSDSQLVVVVNLPGANASAGITVQAQNVQGVTTGWSEPVSSTSGLAEPEAAIELAEDAQDDAAAVAAVDGLDGAETGASAGVTETAPAPDASHYDMLAWLRARVEAVRKELRETRAALAAARHDVRTARAELRAARQEFNRLRKQGESSEEKGKPSEEKKGKPSEEKKGKPSEEKKGKPSKEKDEYATSAAAAATAAASEAVEAAQNALSDAERVVAAQRGKREELRKALAELIDEIQTRRRTQK